MRRRKLLALGLAGLMIISSAMPVFAADATTEPATGSISGTGTIEGYVDKDVFTVTLPTVTTTNFSVDPQELKLAVDADYEVDETKATAGSYGDKVIFNYTPEGGSAAGDYTKSADIKVVNKSTFDVDVKVDAAVTGLKTDDYDIALVEDVTASDVTGPAISLVLTDSANTLTGTTEGSATKGTDKKLTGTDSFTYKVAKSVDVDKAYEVKKDGNVYTYKIKDTVSDVAFNEVILNVSGAVKKNADWTDFNKAATKSLKLEVTYSVTKHVDKPTIATTSLTWAKGSDATINFSLGTTGATGVKEIKYVNGSGATVNLATSNYTATSSAITIKSSFVDAIINSGTTKKEFTVVFNDSAATSVKVTFATAAVGG